MANNKKDFNKGLKDLSDSDAISPLENPMSIRGLRQDIARLKTELQKRALA